MHVSGRKKKTTATVAKYFRRRSAIESIIGHAKNRSSDGKKFGSPKLLMLRCNEVQNTTQHQYDFQFFLKRIKFSSPISNTFA